MSQNQHARVVDTAIDSKRDEVKKTETMEMRSIVDDSLGWGMKDYFKKGNLYTDCMQPIRFCIQTKTPPFPPGH